MMSEIDFENYLFLNKKKLNFFVIHKKSFEIIYLDQLILNDNHYKFNFEKINEFLEKNIFKVEKILNNFKKNIYIILDSDDFFSVKLSIKNNNGNYINSNSLLYL